MELLEAVTTVSSRKSVSRPQGDTAKGISLANALLLTDFSPSSELALPYALALARQYRGKVCVVHVISPEMYEYLPPELVPRIRTEIQNYGQGRMQQLLAYPELQQVPHEAVVREGEIWETLKKITEDSHIDVIVVGTRGRRGLKKALTGAVADEVLHLASSPVLTVGPRCRGIPPPVHKLKRILYATDFSADSVRALGYAASLAETFEASLVPTYVASQIAEDPSATTRFEQFFEERLQELLAGQISRAPVEYRVKFGTPADGILQAAAEGNVDVIVMACAMPALSSVPLNISEQPPTGSSLSRVAQC